MGALEGNTALRAADGGGLAMSLDDGQSWGHVSGVIAVADEAALAATNVAHMPIGTLAYVVADALYFQLVTSGPNLIWQQISLGTGGIQPATGSNLTDADATVNPASSAISASTLPVATLSANRTLTLGVSGSPVTGHIYQVIRRDLTARTYTVKDDAGTTLFTFASSPTTAQGATFYYNGTHYAFLSFYYVA
jgi:hypothetical protein